jgi:acetolactate synthase-1/2/3 large subunit
VKIKLSDYIFEFLVKKQVKNVFLLSGGSAMHLVDSLGANKNIRYVACHHEQACAMAAEAYAKFTNELGVALVTSGPGATNTITGVAGAYLDSVPCLFISGQSKRMQTVQNSHIQNLRQFGVQEIDIIPIVNPITKYAVMVNDPNEIKYILEKAFCLATTGRPGPVWLDVPLDVQNAMIDPHHLKGFDPKELKLKFKIKPEVLELKGVSKLLKQAQRPVLLAGHGIRLSGAMQELEALVVKYKIPVVTPFMAIDVLPSDHPCYIGRIGGKGTRAGNFSVQNADLVISVGSRLSVSSVGHEYQLFAREAKIVVVDIDPSEHKKRTIRIDKFINSDAKLFLQKFMAFLKKEKIADNSKWLHQCADWKRKYPVCLTEYAKIKQGINYYYFVDTLTSLLNNRCSIVSDAGSSFYVVSQAVKIKRGQRYITSGGLATMGFNLPAAIGVSVGGRKSPVAVVTGEGSFQLNIQELQTIIQHQLPIKMFVVNNGGYLSIKNTQKKFFAGNLVGEGETSGVSFPVTKRIANAYKIKYFRAQKSQELKSILKRVVAYPGPVICEIISLEEQEIIPTVSSFVRPDGKMISKPLEDMYPFLDRDEFKKNMFVKPLEE